MVTILTRVNLTDQSLVKAVMMRAKVADQKAVHRLVTIIMIRTKAESRQ